MKPREVRFEVTGGLDVPEDYQEIRSAVGEVVGFRLPDGRTVRLMVALEVEAPGGESYRSVAALSGMEALGFTCLEYADARFLLPE